MLYQIFQLMFFPDYGLGEVQTYNGGTSFNALSNATSTGTFSNPDVAISGHQTSTFFDVFGNIGGFFAVFQKIGLFLAIVIFLWQAFRSLYGPITGDENPYTLGARLAITVAMIYGAQCALSVMLEILRVLYAMITWNLLNAMC